METGSLPITSFAMEAPDPEPEPQQRQEPESRPSAGPARGSPARGQDDDRFAALQRENDELRSSNRSLVDIVGRTTPARPAAEASRETAEDEDGIDWGEDDPESDDEPEADDPATLVDDLSKLGTAALAKRGFVKLADVRKLVREESRKAAVTASRQVVGRARQQATTESTIMQEFPDLADPNSDLFKATIPHVNAAARFNPKAAKDPVTLYLAAKAAKAELAAKAGTRRPAANDDDEDDDREPVRRTTRTTREDGDREERDIRIASQQGDRGRQRSRIENDREEDVVMSSDARAVAKMMGLTDAEYKAEATRVKSTQTQRRGR